MGAKFEIEGVFSIRGRGLVLTGWVDEGRIKTGMTFSLPTISNKLTVLGFEWPHVDPKAGLRRGLIGLLFSLGSDEANASWKNRDIAGQFIEINDPD